MRRPLHPAKAVAAPVGRGSSFFNPFPRYLQIRNLLERRLAEAFSPGDRFPTEHQLCSEFGVSRETIREALLGLESDGLIARHRGRGTFVSRLPDVPNDERLTGLVEDFTELRLDTQAEVVKATIESIAPRVAAALHLDRNARRFRIQRLRRLDGRPFAFHDAFLPVEIGSKVAARDLTRTTLFRELSRFAGVKLTEIYQHIDAVAADVRMAKLLEIDAGAPLLVTRRAIAHDASRTPSMLFETYFRGDRYYYSVQLDRSKSTPGSAEQGKPGSPGGRTADATKVKAKAKTAGIRRATTSPARPRYSRTMRTA